MESETKKIKMYDTGVGYRPTIIQISSCESVLWGLDEQGTVWALTVDGWRFCKQGESFYREEKK